MGDVGCGNITKIVNNLIALTCFNVSAEAFVLGVKGGVDARKLFEAVTSGSGSNRQLQDVFPRTILQGNFEPGFELGLALKDVSLATTLAREYGIPLPLGTTVEQRLIEAKAAGLGKKSSAAYILRLEELAGVKVRYSP